MSRIKYFSFLLWFLFIVACSPQNVTTESVPAETVVVIPSPTLPAVTSFIVTGTYATQTYDNGAVCILQIKGEPELTFHVNCNRGAPSYNMGILSGAFKVLEPNVGLFQTDQFGNCELRFEFSETSVDVTQTGTDFECGFGNGVTANGSYTFQTSETSDIP